MPLESVIIQEIKRQMCLRGFPLVEESPAPRGPDLVCYLPSPGGDKRAVAVIEIKTFASRTTTSDLLNFVHQFQAEYAGRTDGDITIWYKRVIDKNGEESLIRIADLPPIQWAGELIQNYPEDVLVQKLGWFREQITTNQSRATAEPEIAYQALLILINAKLAAEKEKDNRFRVMPKDNWGTLSGKIRPLLPVEYFEEIRAIGEKNPVLSNLLLRFSREIQPYNLSRQKSALTRLLREQMATIIDRREGFVGTPANVAVFIRKLLEIIVHPGLIIEMGCGLGSIASELFKAWPKAKYIACEVDPWIAGQAELLMNLDKPDNGEVLNCDIIGPYISLPEKLRVFGQNAEIDLVVSHPPVGKPSSLESYKWFELARGRRFNFEELFLERALEIIRQGGLICMVLPDGLLSGKGTRAVREFILRESWLNAIISLPQGIFAGSPGLKASIVVIRKKIDRENQDKIFMAEFTSIAEFNNKEIVNSVVTEFKEWAKGREVVG